MVKIFKTVAILEGISYLALFTNMLLVKPNNPDLYHQLLYPIGCRTVYFLLDMLF